MSDRREITFDGMTADAILQMSDEELRALVFTGRPVVFRVGSAQVLGQFSLADDRLIVELAQIEGGGEGVLPALWTTTERYALGRGFSQIEWIVHAIHCAKPNLKLRRVLVRRGFEIRDVSGIGEAYYYLHAVPPSRPHP
jgi:hypothetical protein